MSLYNDAKNGTLNEITLEAYLNTGNIIDIPSTEDDETEGQTALALAASKGNATVVQLLLEHGADVDALSSEFRTPLWIVTARGKGKERAKIVGLLLQYKADPKYSHPSLFNGSTPLMNEMRQLKDRDIIRLLVNAQGVTPAAEQLAIELKMTDTLISPSVVKKLRKAIVDNVMAFIQFVIAWANKLGRIVNAIFDRFGIKGWFRGGRVDNINKEISTPKTKKEFQASTREFLRKYNLENFFVDGGGHFLDTLITKAMEVQKDKSSAIGKAGKTDDLVKLTLYQPVIYCDDSGSMEEPLLEDETRMTMQARIVERISSICTQLVPDNFGAHLRFINTRLQVNADNLQIDSISRQLEQVQPYGHTEIGTNLRNQILDPFVYNVEKMTRPLLVSIITDGIPSGPTDSPEDTGTLKREIIECRRYLKRKGLPERAVLFQLSQVGNDNHSRAFLDGLRDDISLRGILYVTAQNLDSQYDKFRSNEDKLETWLFSTLLIPILDSRQG